MSNYISEVSDASFDAEVLKSSTPVLVDFWAEWCSPCRMMLPVLEGAAQEYTGKIKFVKLNVDMNSEAPAKYGIRGIPTLLMFKNGELAATKVGGLSKAQLKDFLDGQLVITP